MLIMTIIRHSLCSNLSKCTDFHRLYSCPFGMAWIPFSTAPTASNPKATLSASPNRLTASRTASEPDAAKVMRKKISSVTLGSTSGSALDQLPLAMSTPPAIPAWKISSSISRAVLVDAAGCLCNRTRTQSSVLISWVSIKRQEMIEKAANVRPK